MVLGQLNIHVQKNEVGTLFTLVRILQRKRTNRIYADVEKQIHYEGLAHKIMVAKLEDSWRPREARAAVLVQT